MNGNGADGEVEPLRALVVRLAGDSGDGMQMMGELFSESCALAGHALCTFVDFPAEIRAPQGTLPGVSAYQLQFGAGRTLTPGDRPDVLLVMNPAALRVHLCELASGGTLMADADTFNESSLRKAGYAQNPLVDPDLRLRFRVADLQITTGTLLALADSALGATEKKRCRNFYALGVLLATVDLPREPVLRRIEAKWRNDEAVALANSTALCAGGEAGVKLPRRNVARSAPRPGHYRKINGNEAAALGFQAAARIYGKSIVLGGYPITPASSILELLARNGSPAVKTVQAEDEMAAAGIALGASWAGSLGISVTSGPGLCLMAEFLGLAVMAELPLVVVDVQRAGPSTGLPTKTEQSDLLMALFGRHGESPLPVLAARSPADCFAVVFEACGLALRLSTPVLVLSDGYLASSSEIWRIPDPDELLAQRGDAPVVPDGDYQPYRRDLQSLARHLAPPGEPGHEHRIGGLEKNEQGWVSYDPGNHELMVKLRARKIRNIAQRLPPLAIEGDKEADLIIVGWGSTYGAIAAAVEKLCAEGRPVALAHLRQLAPLPADLPALLERFPTVLVPELNLGQLALLLQDRLLRKVVPLSKVRGQPFTVVEICERVRELSRGRRTA